MMRLVERGIWLVSFGMDVHFSSSFCRERTSEKKKRKNEITAKPQKNLIHVKANKGKTVNSLSTKKVKGQKSPLKKKPL
jgi:hypothetical protein